MMPSYWHKQAEKPLFPEMVWARPEMKSAAGKLLVIGGHAESFAAPAEAYNAAEQAGAGSIRTVLPAVLERTVSKLFPAADFAPSNPSGGFATDAVAELLDSAQWADGVLLAGDLGRNSETLATLENFAGKYSGQLTITKDAADYFSAQPGSLIARPESLLAVNLGQLQKLAAALHAPYAFTSQLGLVPFVQQLHTLTATYPQLFIVIRWQSHAIVAVAGQVSTTSYATFNTAKAAVADTISTTIWQVRTAAAAATWWLQNPGQPFAALTSSVLESSL